MRYQASFSPWFYVIPVAGIAFIFYYRSQKPVSLLKEDAIVPESKPDCKEVVEFNRYAGGHPEINEVVHPCLIHLQPGIIQICKYLADDKSRVACVGKIPMESVVEIRVEDIFTMKRKMSTESWLISHKYFEGLSNRKGTEVAFIVIEWVMDEEHRFTYLCIEGDFAMEIAVKKRNAVVKKARQQAIQFA